jgi:hypothetical protein
MLKDDGVKGRKKDQMRLRQTRRTMDGFIPQKKST